MRTFLPNSGAVLCQDRFGLTDTDELQVPFWDLLKVILSKKITNFEALIDLLEDIAITLRGTANTDYGYLKAFLLERYVSKRHYFFSHVWRSITALVLGMPDLFPEGSLPCLSDEHPKLILSRRHVACLVAHQFLCSLPSQSWETDSSVDFHIWYQSEPAIPGTVQAYLCALFTYFERIADAPVGNSTLFATTSGDWPLTFTLRSLSEEQARLDRFHENKLVDLQIVRLSEASNEVSLLGLPNGACVISANKNVGFGSSGTQEETQVGSSPEACPVVLFTPTLKAAEVLVVQGAEAMISMKGYGRQARLDRILEPDYDLNSTVKSIWSQRTMIFMDALELDMYDSAEIVADLLPGNVDRELRKGYTAFSSETPVLGNYKEVFTGLWGCGAFGGNPQVKTLIQWCTASMVGVPLRFICAGAQQQEFATTLENLVRLAVRRDWTVGDILGVLRPLMANGDDARNVFSHTEKVLV